MSPALSLAAYAKEVVRLAQSATTTEETYYPAIRNFLGHILSERKLPFEIRTGTSEEREGGGTDLPDVALYDGEGDFIVVCGEVKLPSQNLEDLALSIERNDQIGRYLAKTRVVLLSNVRSFGLLTVRSAWSGRGAVPPEERHLEQVIEIWSSASALQLGKAPITDEAEDLADLVETAVTRYASIAEPESLARILARQARRAKADLPDQFSNAVGGLLDDFGKALGITFEGPDGEEFFRSSLIQTAFYGLFAGWALWRFSGSRAPFHWEDLGTYLKIPFLGELFYEFRHPARIRELRLARHLDIATETLLRVDSERFFARFHLPNLQSAAAKEEDIPTAAIVYFYEPFLEAFDPSCARNSEFGTHRLRSCSTRFARSIVCCGMSLAAIGGSQTTT